MADPTEPMTTPTISTTAFVPSNATRVELELIVQRVPSVKRSHREHRHH